MTADGSALRRQEMELKRQRLEGLMRSLKLDGLVIGRRDNFAWLTGGGDNHVVLATEMGEGYLLVEPERWTLIATNIETPRLTREELAELPVPLDVEAAPWWQGVEPTIERLVRGKRVASDTGVAGTPSVAAALQALRLPLTPPECERIRALGREAAQALEQVLASEVAPGQTELEVAGRISRALWERGLEPTVVLVAADERVRQYRHPVPTERAIERYVMGVVCARRGGLTVALTRLVHFGRLPGDLRARHEAVCRVDAAMIAATRPGARVAEVLEAGVQAYRREGYPEEWRLHHQGGAIGYAPREYLATPDGSQVVTAPAAFAWNPSITGTKSEDTILVGANSPDAIEIITAHGPQWPTVEVEVAGSTLRRPGILELSRSRASR
ncbi:MAG TPA: M24 family metallopeptidase [Limnochordales bacterium]